MASHIFNVKNFSGYFSHKEMFIRREIDRYAI